MPDDQQVRPDRASERLAERSIVGDVAAVAAAVTPVVVPVVQSYLHRPPKEQPPQVVLPPGVSKND